MIGALAFCSVSMIGMFIFQQVVYNQAMLIVLTVAFICGFEFGPGPILWLYLSEICNNKATSLNTVVNWVWTLIISLATPVIFKAIGGATWLIFASTCALGLIYVIAYMKETRNLAKDQVKRLYYKDRVDYQLV